MANGYDAGTAMLYSLYIIIIIMMIKSGIGTATNIYVNCKLLAPNIARKRAMPCAI